MKRLRARYGCPAELALEFVGGKWKTVILCWLKDAPQRYGELRAHIPDLSDKVLSERLKELEDLGLAEKAGIGRNKVYRLTARGEGLRPMLTALYDWGEAMSREVPVRIGSRGVHTG